MLRFISLGICCGVVLIVAVVLNGCGGGGMMGSPVPSSRAHPPSSSSGSLTLGPLTPEPTASTQRWMDLANNLYATAFASSFGYPRTGVTLHYTTGQTSLQFGVTALAGTLKPNFCYQMKLVGPSVAWPKKNPRTTDFTNYALGSNGRWYDQTQNMNLTDSQLSSHVGDLITGYLYFDFLVTAADGSVNYTSTVNNSYHVTFMTTQQARTRNDGPLRACTVTAPLISAAYSGLTYPTVVVTLYAQQEPGRSLPGKLTLPSGTYSGVQFVLTEESFHSTDPLGGNWDTVMAATMPDFTLK